MNRKQIKSIGLAILATFGGLLLLILLLIGPSLGRWWELQKAGQMSEMGNTPTSYGQFVRDSQIASWTTWWGKKLDPSEFWRDRPVWNDETAQAAAMRRGRSYPPIPWHIKSLTEHFECYDVLLRDQTARTSSLDAGYTPPYRGSEGESRYWAWFWMNQPKPPSTLQREQFDVAKRILEIRQPLVVNGMERRTWRSTEDRKAGEQIWIKRAREIGVPKEALDDEALFWAYVLKQRQEFAKEMALADKLRVRAADIADRRLGHFLEGVLVDSKFITEPLTPEQLKAANAWKITYLQRLRREKTDESYIKAYLEAWNLSEEEVFPRANDGQ